MPSHTKKERKKKLQTGGKVKNPGLEERIKALGFKGAPRFAEETAGSLRPDLPLHAATNEGILTEGPLGFGGGKPSLLNVGNVPLALGASTLQEIFGGVKNLKKGEGFFGDESGFSVSDSLANIVGILSGLGIEEDNPARAFLSQGLRQGAENPEAVSRIAEVLNKIVPGFGGDDKVPKRQKGGRVKKKKQQPKQHDLLKQLQSLIEQGAVNLGDLLGTNFEVPLPVGDVGEGAQTPLPFQPQERPPVQLTSGQLEGLPQFQTGGALQPVGAAPGNPLSGNQTFQAGAGGQTSQSDPLLSDIRRRAGEKFDTGQLDKLSGQAGAFDPFGGALGGQTKGTLSDFLSGGRAVDVGGITDVAQARAGRSFEDFLTGTDEQLGALGLASSSSRDQILAREAGRLAQGVGETGILSNVQAQENARNRQQGAVDQFGRSRGQNLQGLGIGVSGAGSSASTRAGRQSSQDRNISDAFNNLLNSQNQQLNRQQQARQSATSRPSTGPGPSATDLARAGGSSFGGGLGAGRTSSSKSGARSSRGSRRGSGLIKGRSKFGRGSGLGQSGGKVSDIAGFTHGGRVDFDDFLSNTLFGETFNRGLPQEAPGHRTTSAADFPNVGTSELESLQLELLRDQLKGQRSGRKRAKSDRANARSQRQQAQNRQARARAGGGGKSGGKSANRTRARDFLTARALGGDALAQQSASTRTPIGAEVSSLGLGLNILNRPEKSTFQGSSGGSEPGVAQQAMALRIADLLNTQAAGPQHFSGNFQEGGEVNQTFAAPEQTRQTQVTDPTGQGGVLPPPGQAPQLPNQTGGFDPGGGAPASGVIPPGVGSFSLGQGQNLKQTLDQAKAAAEARSQALFERDGGAASAPGVPPASVPGLPSPGEAGGIVGPQGPPQPTPVGQAPGSPVTSTGQGPLPQPLPPPGQAPGSPVPTGGTLPTEGFQIGGEVDGPAVPPDQVPILAQGGEGIIPVGLMNELRETQSADPLVNELQQLMFQKDERTEGAFDSPVLDAIQKKAHGGQVSSPDFRIAADPPTDLAQLLAGAEVQGVPSFDNASLQEASTSPVGGGGGFLSSEGVTPEQVLANDRERRVANAQRRASALSELAAKSPKGARIQELAKEAQADAERLVEQDFQQRSEEQQQQRQAELQTQQLQIEAQKAQASTTLAEAQAGALEGGDTRKQVAAFLSSAQNRTAQEIIQFKESLGIEPTPDEQLRALDEKIQAQMSTAPFSPSAKEEQGNIENIRQQKEAIRSLIQRDQLALQGQISPTTQQLMVQLFGNLGQQKDPELRNMAIDIRKFAELIGLSAEEVAVLFTPEQFNVQSPEAAQGRQSLINQQQVQSGAIPALRSDKLAGIG